MDQNIDHYKVINDFNNIEDEFFTSYISLVLSKTKKWIANNPVLAVVDNIPMVKSDALSVSYVYYLDVVKNRFPDDINQAQKYWYKTFWFKLLDYLSYHYLNIEPSLLDKKADNSYHRTRFVYLDGLGFNKKGDAYFYEDEKLLNEHHMDSAEVEVIADLNIAWAIKTLKDFAYQHYDMYCFQKITRDEYSDIIHFCVDSQISMIERYGKVNASGRGQVCDYNYAAKKFNLHRNSISIYFNRFKRDAAVYLREIVECLYE